MLQVLPELARLGATRLGGPAPANGDQLMRFSKLRWALMAVLGGLMAQSGRISGPTDPNRRALLRGHVNPQALPKYDRGAVEPSFKLTSMILVLKPSEAQQAALDQLLAEQQNPASPQPRKWLTPEEYGDRFGATVNDIARISDWLRSEGFTVASAARGRNWIAFSGTAEKVEAAFHTSVHRYDVDGEMHFAISAEPSIPAALGPMVMSLLGLDDFDPRASQPLRPAAALASGLIALTPADLGTIYGVQRLHQAGIDGTGQKIAVVGDSAIDLSDIQMFRKTFDLGDANVQTVLAGPDPGLVPGLVAEPDLDLEVSGAMAPNATLVYVYSKSLTTAIFAAIDQNLAPVLSQSSGTCEAHVPSSVTASYEAEAKKANSMGITWVVATGDTGAANCDRPGPFATQGLAVSFPSNLPEVTAVGGTEFNEDTGAGNFWASPNGAAQSYVPEMAWNDTIYTGLLNSGGGGVSKIFPKPSWQTGAGVPNDNARDLPDISLAAANAHDSYLFVTAGQLALGGGTSAAAPVFAGFVALLNQHLAQNGSGAGGNQPHASAAAGFGNINPHLYQLAQTNPGNFHDIVTGNNMVPCEAESPDCVNGQLGYSAGPGYDLATGLGSVDAYNMVTGWNGIPSGTPVIRGLAPVPNTAGGPSFTLTVNGANFTAGAQVQWNGTGLTTMMVSSTELQAQVDATLIASPGIVAISVTQSGKTSGVAFYTVSASTGMALSVSGERVTKTAPNACDPPTVDTSFVTTDATIYFWFQATVTANDRLIISWLAPDNTAYYTVYPGLQPGTNYCGLSTNFSIANLPASQLGTWQARLYDNATLLISIPFTVTLPGAATPTVGAVVNGASFTPGAPVAPGSLATLFGTGFAPKINASTVPLPTQLSGVSVLVNGRPAPLVFLNPTQVNFQVPLETRPGRAKVIVETNGIPSSSFDFQVQAVAPGLFVALNNADGTPNGGAHPASVSDFLIVYLTGQGPVDQPAIDGVPAPNPPPLSNATKPFSATIGGATATVAFLGLSPGFVGLAQADVQVPKLSPGSYPLVLTVGSVASNALMVSVK